MRRIARIPIDSKMLLDQLRGGGAVFGSDALGGVTFRYSSVNLPKDAEILGVEWDYSSNRVVLICESAEFEVVGFDGVLSTRALTCRTEVRRMSIVIDK